MVLGGWSWVQRMVFSSLGIMWPGKGSGKWTRQWFNQGVFLGLVSVQGWSAFTLSSRCPTPSSRCPVLAMVYDTGWCHALPPFWHVPSHFGTVKCSQFYAARDEGEQQELGFDAGHLHGQWWYTGGRIVAGVPMISTFEVVPVYSFLYLMATAENTNILKRPAFSPQSPVSLLQSKDDT